MKLRVFEVSWSIKLADCNANSIRYNALIRFAFYFSIIQPRRPAAGLDAGFGSLSDGIRVDLWRRVAAQPSADAL